MYPVIDDKMTTEKSIKLQKRTGWRVIAPYKVITMCEILNNCPLVVNNPYFGRTRETLTYKCLIKGADTKRYCHGFYSSHLKIKYFCLRLFFLTSRKELTNDATILFTRIFYASAPSFIIEQLSLPIKVGCGLFQLPILQNCHERK